MFIGCLSSYLFAFDIVSPIIHSEITTMPLTFPKALLALADGTTFQGISIGSAGHSSGEVVFNTAMTGYQEILTDPS